MIVPFFTLKREYALYRVQLYRAISRVVRSGNFILGSEGKAFEKLFASYLNVSYAVGVNSGTDGLFLALRALGVKKGDEVITQANSFIATASAIIATGATPVFVDVERDTFQMSLADLEKKITKKTKAIIPVHLYGAPGRIADILEIAKKHALDVIEDACQAHGSEYNGKKLGTFGKIGVFSFYPAKNLGAYGDGGAVVTNDKALYRYLLMARNHGQKEKYFHEIEGINSRLDEMQAAILQVKLSHLSTENVKRKKAADLYSRLLKGVQTQLVIPKGTSNYYLFAVLHPQRKKLQKFLEKHGIGTLIHYPIPLHLQKSLSFLGYKLGDFPNTEVLAETSLSLPLFSGIKESEIRYVCSKILSFNKNSARK